MLTVEIRGVKVFREDAGKEDRPAFAECFYYFILLGVEPELGLSLLDRHFLFGFNKNIDILFYVYINKLFWF